MKRDLACHLLSSVSQGGKSCSWNVSAVAGASHVGKERAEEQTEGSTSKGPVDHGLRKEPLFAG